MQIHGRMVGSPNLLSTSGLPWGVVTAPKGHTLGSMSDASAEFIPEDDGLRRPQPGGGRSMSTSNSAGPARGVPFATSAPRGSFSSELPSSTGHARPSNHIRIDTAPSSGAHPNEHEQDKSDRKVAELNERLNKELKIKEGSENLLEALNTKKAKQAKDQIARVESELNASNRKIAQLNGQIEELRHFHDSEPSTRSRIANLFSGGALRSPATTPDLPSTREPELLDEAESPTFALSELLQSLEAEGMPSDHYVERANQLVHLFKRHNTLKYDLAWSVFGLRMQTLLLSDSREIVAAGYRVTRYAIADRRSLQTIRTFHTDYLVILCVCCAPIFPRHLLPPPG